jgi:hypothetical protein
MPKADNLLAGPTPDNWRIWAEPTVPPLRISMEQSGGGFRGETTHDRMTSRFAWTEYEVAPREAWNVTPEAILSPLALVEPLKITEVTCCPVKMTRLLLGGRGSMYPALESDRVWLTGLMVDEVNVTPRVDPSARS